MSSADKHVAASGPIAELERVLLERIRVARDDLQRAEGLEEEQRAEIHTILEAIRHDREHRVTPAGGGQYVPVRDAMTERAALQRHFSQILAAVQAAAAEYERLASAAADPRTRQECRRLAREERRHIELAGRLEEIVNE